MRGRVTRIALSLSCLAAGLVMTRPVLALDVTNNVAFNAVNLSPWDSGPAIDLQNDQTISKSFNVDLPSVDGNPIKALADFLGVPLPVDASVSIGAHTDGNVALDFGYAVTAGRLNLSYPAVGTLSIPTAAGTNQISNPAFTLTSSFQPGLQQKFVPSIINLAPVAGGGYTLLPGSLGVTSTQFKDPTFTTNFPSFAAWADASYNINAGASINADLKILGQCIVCASKTFTLGDSESFPIVEITSGGIKVLGESVANAAATIPIAPGASATVSIPNLKVGSSPLAPGSTTLTGSGSQPVIQLNLSLEKLVPVIGAFLSNSVGPFGYNLLSVDGGPNLSIYQNFSFAPDPKVQLLFSQTMLVQGTDGVYRPTNVATFDLGAPLNIKVPFGTQNIVTVQPTYILDNLFSNETGLSLGASVTVSGLSLSSPIADLGPAFTDTLTVDGLVHIPLYKNTFEEPLGSITPDPFTIDVGSHLSEKLQRFAFDGVADLGQGMFDVRFKDLQTGDFVDLVTPGQTLTTPRFCPPNIDSCPSPLTILETSADLLLDGVDIGSDFCIFCIEATGPLANLSPSVTDDLGSVLFLNDLTDFPTGECESNIGICDGTIAAANRVFEPSDPTTTQIVTVAATVVVSDAPEPASLFLMAWPAALWIALRRRRRPSKTTGLG